MAAQDTATRSPLEVAESDFAAVASRDPSGIAAHYHPEAIVDFVVTGVVRGPDGVREYFEGTFGAAPDFDLRPERHIVDGNVVVTPWRASGTFSGAPFQGLEPTGRWFELRGLDVMEIEEGLIRSNVVYYDGAEFARGIGMLPPQDSAAERVMTQAFNGVTKLRKAIAGRSGGDG